MVTSLDALMDTALISVGLDATLCYWDLRVLSTTQLAPAVARMQVGGAGGGGMQGGGVQGGLKGDAVLLG